MNIYPISPQIVQQITTNTSDFEDTYTWYSERERSGDYDDVIAIDVVDCKSRSEKRTTQASSNSVRSSDNQDDLPEDDSNVDYCEFTKDVMAFAEKKIDWLYDDYRSLLNTPCCGEFPWSKQSAKEMTNEVLRERASEWVKTNKGLTKKLWMCNCRIDSTKYHGIDDGSGGKGCSNRCHREITLLNVPKTQPKMQKDGFVLNLVLTHNNTKHIIRSKRVASEITGKPMWIDALNELLQHVEVCGDYVHANLIEEIRFLCKTGYLEEPYF